ncbi:MAG: hypothetical protein WBE43_11900 [Candidatus Acidiferrales bacterium]
MDSTKDFSHQCVSAHGSLGAVGHLDSNARPFPDLRDAHAPVWLPAHRHPVQPRSSIQAGAESVAAPLVYADARNVEVLTDPQPVNAGRDLAVLARLLDAWTEVRVSQRDAALVAARSIDNLTISYGTVRLDPVAPPPTVGGGRVVDLLAIAV